MVGRPMQDKPAVAFLGPLGTYTHQAAYEKFGSDVEYIEQNSIAEVFDSLSTTVDIGIVPQENSIFGPVIETYDCLRRDEPIFVRDEIILAIQHCLIVRKGVQLSDIDCVMSHEQALGQCRSFLETELPHASLKKMPSTSAAAKALLSSPLTYAAICSKACLTVFDGLELLNEGIQDQHSNFTRFYVVAKSSNEVPSSTERRGRALLRLSVDVSNKSASIMTLLAALRINYISRIDRRPALDSVPFHDMYFVELNSIAEQSQDIWEREIEHGLERVRLAGGAGKLLGIW
ncbi:PDT-domain-containing protein [Guyanagaster necrorhizus]|uniref:prephenate dehydratase n=1 Tax=Guyanagaster necrorhizus TaxID=856835 RepID=A0A9P7W1C4_9AGAR|nr:PDT-domain-containing protein [Guyanagaster necrorhizus MCA 3950]KAG7450413.1 PDT-domain-containing protein [Guyanagaster necrorhizus MCA 3950]